MMASFSTSKFGLRTMVLTFAVLASFCVVKAAPANVNPFQKVAGKAWRSTSATVKLKGGVDRISCRARYSVSGIRTNFNLKCSGPSYFINVVANFTVSGGKISGGSWNEYSFGKKGWVSGRANAKSASVHFKGSDVIGSMYVNLSSSNRQTITVKADGARATIHLRR